MPTNPVERGPVSEAVAANIRAIRGRRQMTAQDLCARLEELGRPMQRSAVAKVEAGDRRVDVDDLLAFAAALNVTPARLLLPDAGMDDPVNVTPGWQVPMWAAWRWITGTYPLAEESGEKAPDVLQRKVLGYWDERPLWLRTHANHPLSTSLQHLDWAIRRALEASPRGRSRWLNSVKQAVARLNDAITQTESESSRG